MEAILKAMMQEELDELRITYHKKKGLLVLTFTKIKNQIPSSHSIMLQGKFLTDDNEKKTQLGIQYILNKLKEL